MQVQIVIKNKNISINSPCHMERKFKESSVENMDTYVSV